MTRYIITARPDFGSFEFATVAALIALRLGVDPGWEED